MLYASNIKATVGEIQREYLYIMGLVSVPDSVSSDHASATSQMQSDLDLYNVKGIFPDRKTDMIQLKWGGESVFYSGIDASTKTGQLIFYDDESGLCREFWNACKDLTGSQAHQVAQEKEDSVFDISVSRVDVARSVVTAYRLLEDVQVSGVSESDPNKEGTKENRITVTITWDRNTSDSTQIGASV